MVRWVRGVKQVNLCLTCLLQEKNSESQVRQVKCVPAQFFPPPAYYLQKFYWHYGGMVLQVPPDHQMAIFSIHENVVLWQFNFYMWLCLDQSQITPKLWSPLLIGHMFKAKSVLPIETPVDEIHFSKQKKTPIDEIHF